MNRCFSGEVAASHVGISEAELDCYRILGLVKFKTLGDGEIVYFEKDLEDFHLDVLLGIEKILIKKSKKIQRKMRNRRR